MRYFRYKNTNKNINNALKEQYKTLTKDEKRTARKGRIWAKISTTVVVVVFAMFMVGGICLLESIPMPNVWLWKILAIVGVWILGFGLIIISTLLAYIVTSPLWKKVESFHLPKMRKEIFSKACSHLRDFYELQDQYITTKCFAATDKKFENHDVCIFVVGDELRITADLVRGFLHGKRDLGCYAFKRNEITLSKQRSGDQLRLELKVGDTAFMLGYRAKGFIENNFTGVS